MMRACIKLWLCYTLCIINASPILRCTMTQVADLTLTQALARYPRDFPDVYRALVAAGEQSGDLALVMGRLADYVESRTALTQRIMLAQNRLMETVPEVASVMGKMGRAETALDPAPIGMIETVVLLKPYNEWPTHEITKADGTVEHRPRTLAEVRAALAAITDIPGVAPSGVPTACQ